MMVTVDSAETDTQARLRAALWHAVGQSVDGAALTGKPNASARFIGTLSELVYEKINSTAADLEAFARSADRTVINTKDVMLLARHNDVLKRLLQQQATEAHGEASSTRE
jgi:histone H3/H4